MQVLLIDFNADNAGLLSHSIKRRFPHATVHHHTEAPAAVAAMSASRYDAVVIHRTYDLGAIELVKTSREVAPHVVIIAVSGIDKSEDVIAAGATGFLHYDAWLRIGTVLEQALKDQGETRGETD